MKIKVFTYFLITALLFISVRAFAFDENFVFDPEAEKVFDIESGTVEYSFKQTYIVPSSGFEGTLILFFDHWGFRQSWYRSLRPLNPENESALEEPAESMLIQHLDDVSVDFFFIDLITKTGNDTDNFWTPDIIYKDKEFRSRVSSQGVKQIAGKSCNDFGKYCLWNGIPLEGWDEYSSNLGERFEYTAVRVEEGPVPEEKFKIPLGIKFVSEDEE